MTWFKVPGRFAFEGRVIDAGNAAVGAWIRLGSWCVSNDTDGRIPATILKVIASACEVDELIAAGFLLRLDGDYLIADFGKYAKSSAELKEIRAKWRERRKLTPEMRREMVLNALACGICGATLFEGDDIHVDHVVPLARGGKTERGNLQAAHAACNLKKGAS